MRTIVNYGLLTLFGCLSLTASLYGCADAPQQQRAPSTNKSVPAEWTQELSMASLLAEGLVVNSQSDLAKLLAMPWYAGIDIKTNKAGERKVLNSCNDLFMMKGLWLRAEREQENNSLLEFKVMCETTRLLSTAKATRFSNIPGDLLGAQLPTMLPKSLALITSQIESNRIQNDQSLVHWGDVNSMRKVEEKSPNKSVYYSNAGIQTLSVLGRGDINGDDWGDVLVAVKDTVEGGSYFNLRLFVLTVTAQHQWRIVAQY